VTADSHALVPAEHSPIAGLAHDSREVMFFGGLFAAYFNVRANAPVWPPEEFSHTLQIFPLVGPATILLIASSFTCQFAVWGIRRDDRTAFLRNMTVTVALGITFLLMQGIDYATLGSEGLGLSSGTFGTTYYTLTGFHGAHVFGGVIMLSVVLYRGMAGQFSSRHHDAVEGASLYWHFVDVVWILLFSLLYLWPGK
jgi:cytochrome c oxidase subunit 3